MSIMNILHITRGELAEILTEKLADNSRNSRGSPSGMRLDTFAIIFTDPLYHREYSD